MLVIGMTNRKDMIDEALLRPGRLEVQLEISLPDEFGRVQILKIHTSRLREFKKLGKDVDINDLAKRTKNFSGAEIEGLVRAAQSSAMNRLVKVTNTVQVDPEAIEKFAVGKDDFEYALEHDVKPVNLKMPILINFFNFLGIWPQRRAIGASTWRRLHQLRHDCIRHFASRTAFGCPSHKP